MMGNSTGESHATETWMLSRKLDSVCKSIHLTNVWVGRFWGEPCNGDVDASQMRMFELGAYDGNSNGESHATETWMLSGKLDSVGRSSHMRLGVWAQTGEVKSAQEHFAEDGAGTYSETFTTHSETSGKQTQKFQLMIGKHKFKKPHFSYHELLHAANLNLTWMAMSRRSSHSPIMSVQKTNVSCCCFLLENGLCTARFLLLRATLSHTFTKAWKKGEKNQFQHPS